jgi:hypothetical protein
MVLVFPIFQQLAKSFDEVYQHSLPISIQPFPQTIITHHLQYSANYGFSYTHSHFPVFEDQAHQLDQHLN